MKRFFLALAAIAALQASAADLRELARYAGVSESSLSAAVSQARVQPKIIAAMTRPSEAKPWWEYRKIFITTSRIRAGVEFYLSHEEDLNRAYRTYGVPPEIVCAILGVETLFGRNMGSWRVLDALYTLGFNYPPREAYFSREFANFVKLCLRENWAVASVSGSYAGAMGMGQFMPSSYLDYAVDFNGDGRVNLFTDAADAIGSVANYFRGHGWLKDHGIYYPAHAPAAAAEELIARKWDLSVEELTAAGVTTKVTLSPGQKVRLFKFELEDGSWGYAVGLNNFNAIMRYNTSPLYARAVYELAEFIRMEYAKTRDDPSPPQGRLP